MNLLSNEGIEEVCLVEEVCDNSLNGLDELHKMCG